MPFCDQLVPYLRIIEQFAVEDGRHRAILVVHGLSAVGQSDDAQTTIGHGQAGAEEVAVVIGAAMKNPVGHPADDLGIDRRRAAQTRDSRDATHRRSPGALIAGGRQSINALSMADRAECRPPSALMLTLSGDCAVLQSA